MKIKALSVVTSLFFCVALSFGLHADVNKKALKAEAISIVKKFGGTLKPQLGKALKTGGPAHAIKVCSTQAPAIAEKLRNETGWYVRRVSLKARNNMSATPDAWEAKVLKQFDERQARGESAQKMAFAEVVNGKYRFMKAQGVEKVCLNCHATKVNPEVEAALKKHYPHDKARGYTLGQIRGAFSLARDI
ncbi:MAG: DUF3365 domain-containing protein [Gammaproteobacteria bacterium]|nr:DUF3365 domain-containing protein [Gammaproteobacteria bacterium]